ncbi:MAG: hypothetical protein JWM32_2083 [Verrucomicrobia bacterium]|nr:hypothetical protein [Verrucomicrobiota bacterium]
MQNKVFSWFAAVGFTLLIVGCAFDGRSENPHPLLGWRTHTGKVVATKVVRGIELAVVEVEARGHTIVPVSPEGPRLDYVYDLSYKYFFEEAGRRREITFLRGPVEGVLRIWSLPDDLWAACDISVNYMLDRGYIWIYTFGSDNNLRYKRRVRVPFPSIDGMQIVLDPASQNFILFKLSGYSETAVYDYNYRTDELGIRNDFDRDDPVWRLGKNFGRKGDGLQE